MFVKHRCPRQETKSKYGKNLKVLYFDPAPPQGYVMSVKCEEPIHELTVQVWLLYHHTNFKYCTLFVSGTELRTDGRTNKRTDDPITRCPRQTFQAWGIKSQVQCLFKNSYILDPLILLWKIPHCTLFSTGSSQLLHISK